MIKADGKVAEVSAASILAKVTHDRDILLEAKKYPEYQFEKHTRRMASRFKRNRQTIAYGAAP